VKGDNHIWGEKYYKDDWNNLQHFFAERDNRLGNDRSGFYSVGELILVKDINIYIHFDKYNNSISRLI
jgi:hypothetical protein